MAEKKLTQAEKLSKTSPEELSKLSGQEGRKKLIKDITRLRSAYKRRVDSFRRRNLISYAQIAFENSYPSGYKPLSQMSRNQLIMEFFRYATFFNSETANIEGINKVNRQQDTRIFGADKRGKPIRTMTAEERVMYWQVYDEYKKQFPADVNMMFSSEQIQINVGEALFGGNRIETENLVDILTRVRLSIQEQKEREELNEFPTIFTGTRFNFDW